LNLGLNIIQTVFFVLYVVMSTFGAQTAHVVRLKALNT